jgi:hypothetical protein
MVGVAARHVNGHTVKDWNIGKCANPVLFFLGKSRALQSQWSEALTLGFLKLMTTAKGFIAGGPATAGKCAYVSHYLEA